ncbi:uncharacterized protein LOC126628104 isoform X1 [Malus sylvestris]|uniref:uncharacterized protein LOC126628104 isoform X1 n=1 Tax=Malus sylvestris TaxID=3752 RepID=UPI0021ACFBFB|nr:uncharacterized protein LOC126628104 isoform X1 [Malus sylvestris]
MGFHGRLSSKETGANSRLCSFCSENGCYCDIAEAPFEERNRLIAIKDQVKEVENKFMFLQICMIFYLGFYTCGNMHTQRMSSWQQMDRQAAFNSLEESRLNLVAKVTEYKGRRELDVVTELNACFGSENNVPFNWDFGGRLIKKNEPAGGFHSRSFLTNCIRKLLVSWKWQKVYGIAVKLAMVSVSISSVIAAYSTRQLLCTSSRKMIPFLSFKDAGKSSSLLTFSKNPLDVFFGRG